MSTDRTEIGMENQAQQAPDVADAPEITEEELTEQRRIRRGKLQELREAGRDPFLNETWDVTAHSKDIKDNFIAMEGQEVSCAGRMMSKRVMGKAAFIDIQDKQGRIQVYVKRDDIGQEDYKWFKTYDIGDILGVKGFVFTTKTGEISIHAQQLVLLSKSIQVLPDKWGGLRDQDLRYRQRYVDLIMNQDVKDTFVKRSKVEHEIKRVLEDDYGFLEVTTPTMVPIAGGANARPFETHHNTLDMALKLRISNELYLKRLIVGGLDRVYEMGKMFRNEGMDRNHNPEYTSMECYMAYGNMENMMEITEQIVYKAQLAINGTPILNYQGKEFDVTPPWRRLDMTEAVREVTGIDFHKIDEDDAAREAAIAYGMDAQEVSKWTRGKIIAEMFEEYCEDAPGLMDGPIFLTGHPVEISPLAKRDPQDPRITRRFEAYINGWEIGNAFSELNDPIDQYERFAKQQAELDLGIDDEAHPMDLDFVNALEVGMPPTGGLGIGVDRVIMLITNAQSIRDVILFPTMKPLKQETLENSGSEVENAEIYDKFTTNFSEPKIKIDFSKVEIEPLFTDQVDFDTFSKSDFRAVKVKDCVAVPKSKKLLQFTLDDGTGTDRTILSGIHAFYEPEQLIGKTCIAITNLPPRKMMGIESCGMLLSALNQYDGEEMLTLLMVDDNIPAGAKLY